LKFKTSFELVALLAPVLLTGPGRKWSWANFRYYPCISLKGLWGEREKKKKEKKNTHTHTHLRIAGL
jgi:hypothetical protein